MRYLDWNRQIPDRTSLGRQRKIVEDVINIEMAIIDLAVLCEVPGR
jgi:hypothetical protein